MVRFVAGPLCLLLTVLVGCGGVDVGGIPVDASGMTNNFDFGDINVGDINGLGDAIGDTLASGTEADVPNDFASEAEGNPIDVGEPIERPHPADTNGDFAVTSEELLAYSLAFQDSMLPEGQNEAWVDVAVGIWQTRQDGAYYDDMESPEPNNWRSLDGTAEEDAIDDGEDAIDDELDEEAVNDEEDEGAVAEMESEGAGYDLLFKASSLSVAPVQLSVADPNGHTNTDWDNSGEIGWASGTAWNGVYTVKVGVGNNWNNVSERITFSVRAYVDGELVHDGEYSAAESATWDGLTVTFP